MTECVGGVPAPKVEYIGPFNTTHVVIGGRQVPFLNAYHMADQVSLTLDGRYGLDLTVAQAESVVPFIANCIAVALGYTCHPMSGEEPNRSTPFPRFSALEDFNPSAERESDAR